MVFSRSSRIAMGSAFLAVTLGSAIVSHGTLMTLEGETVVPPETLYLPKTKFIRPFLLGQDAFAADLIWIRTLGYFSDELTRGHKYTYLGDLIDLATDLDPRFERIYIWAGAVYMYRGGAITKRDIMRSIHILE